MTAIGQSFRKSFPGAFRGIDVGSNRRTIPRRCLAVLALCAAVFNPAGAQESAPRTPIPAGPYRISGTVVNAKVGGPLARARVTIADARNRQSMQSLITGDDGRFEFHVPVGKYSLDGAKRGFLFASYNQHDQFSTAIVTGSDLDTENLLLRLAPNAVLTGRVLDEFGEPVRNAQITVYRENHFQGVSRIVRGGGASTDDQGRYEVSPLDEGTIFVSARAAPWYAVHPPVNAEGSARSIHVDPLLDVVYPITFYGDTTEAEDATPIPVRGGDRLQADIHLNPAPSLHLIVHVPQDNERISFPVLQKPAFDGLEEVENPTIQNLAPGVFEISGVAAGRYVMRMPDSSGHMKEPAEINLSGGGELDVSSGNSTAKISATVQIEGSTRLPAQLWIALRNSKGRFTNTTVDANGQVEFSDVEAGKYDIVANSSTQRYSVTRITSEAGATTGHELIVPAEASLNISLTLVGGSVSIEGFAKRAGKGVSGAMIVLAPKDPEANRDRFRRDQSDLDGSFVLPNVIPGSYTIVAIQDGWDLEWAQAGALARYLAHGKTIEVGDRSPTTMRLAGAVEVQTK